MSVVKNNHSYRIMRIPQNAYKYIFLLKEDEDLQFAKEFAEYFGMEVVGIEYDIRSGKNVYSAISTGDTHEYTVPFWKETFIKEWEKKQHVV